MVPDLNKYNQTTEYQNLQKFASSVKVPKGFIQKASKWIEKTFDSIFKSNLQILQKKENKLSSKIVKIENDYWKVLNTLSFELNNGSIKLTKDLKEALRLLLPVYDNSAGVILNSGHDEYHQAAKTLRKEHSKIRKELRREIDYLESLYPRIKESKTKIENKIKIIKEEMTQIRRIESPLGPILEKLRKDAEAI